MQRACGIYLITVSGFGTRPMYYVGQAVDVRRRMLRHLRELKTGCHANARLQRSYKKHGAEAFSFQLLEECTEDDLARFEQWWLDEMFGHAMVANMTCDSLSPTRGRKLSDQHKKAIGDGNRGRTRSEEWKAKKSASMKGVKQSPELVAKRVANRRRTAGKDHQFSKPVIATKMDGTEELRFANAREAEKFGFIHSAISAVCRGASKQHKGYFWRFA